MSNYRLTPNNVKELDLTEVTWETVARCNIKRVFVRASSNAATYGPYKVKDAKNKIISYLDGTNARVYPRDKGLFVKRADLPYSMTGLSRWSRVGYTTSGGTVHIKSRGSNEHRTNLKFMLAEVSAELDETAAKVKSLTARKEALEVALEALSNV